MIPNGYASVHAQSPLTMPMLQYHYASQLALRIIMAGQQTDFATKEDFAQQLLFVIFPMMFPDSVLALALKAIMQITQQENV